MKKTKLLNFLRVTFLLLIFSAFSSSSWAATITGGVTLYFDASGSDWKADNARFAAYLCNGSSNPTWYSLVQVEGDIYSFTVTSGESHNNVIFCRMDPNNPTNDWGAKWNQTGDLVWDGSKNLFKPNSKHNNKNTGTWSTYEEEDLPDALPDAVVCGKKTTLFFEDFGTLDGETIRKQNNQIDGQNFYTSYNYIAECAKIKNAGEYAIVATPRWSGCSSKNDNDYDNTCACGNSDTGKWWYNKNYDHTDDDGDGNPYNDAGNGLYGGMLQFDCRNGSSTDVLYQRTVSGVCSNTLVNFSAWVTKANISDADPIKARFILLKGGADGTIIGRKDIDDIKIDEGWKQISAMFNSGTLNTDGEITIQLINLAPYGQNGNDILLDDLELSVCTPAATLETPDGKTEANLINGQSLNLVSEFVSGVIKNPYYLWQVMDTRTGLWVDISEREQNIPTLQVIPTAPNLKYRVILAPSAEAITNALANKTTICGMYAITNEVTVKTTNLTLKSSISKESICADGVDKNTLTLKVTNPLNVAVTGVKVAVEIPEGVTAYNAGTTTVFTGFAEFDLAANASKTLTLDLKSTAAITASQIKSIKSYIAKTFDLTWDSESALVKASSDITVNPVPTAKFAVASEDICKGSTTIGTNVIISNGSPNYTLTIGGTNYTATTSPYLFAVNPTSTTTYTLTKVMDAKGCYSTPTSNNTVTVNVEEIKITTHPASTSVCVGAGATFSVDASGVYKYQWQISSDNSNWNNISGATASTYNIATTTASDNNKYYRVIVSKDGGKCEAVESNSAILTVKTTAPPSLTRAEYKECATSGDVLLSTLFSGTDLKFYSDAALTNEVTTFSASEVVTDKKYYATQTINGCTSAATEISVTVLELPKLTLATTDKNAICGTESDSKATLTYKFEGGKAPYILSVQRTEDGGETETITPSNLSATGTYTLQPTTKTTYKFTQVKDANGCVSASASGLVDDVVIDVKRLSITSNLNDESVCADKKITYTIGATGDDIKYQWFQSTDNGVSFNEVGTNSNTYTTDKFAMGDTKQYKVVVSQNLDPEVCSSITSAESAVTVKDCSSFELAYTSVKNVVCKEDQIELKLTLSNNSDIDATDVNVKISNISNQYFVSSSSTTYNHVAGTWTIANLRKGDSVTLTIILKGTTVVKDVVSVAYISKSGSTTYTETTTQAKDTENITVKGITAKPTVNNYAACPEEGMLNLVDQVTSDKTNLVFYTTETGFSSKTQSSKNAEGITPYWVTNTKTGECESERTKLDIQVYPQPTATISGTTAICKGESTNLTIALTGTEKYNIVLSSGDGERQVTGSSTTIAVSPTTTTTYTLRTVTDGNGCYATLSGSATITVNDVATIADITAPAAICAGSSLVLPTPVITTNGSTVTNGNWYLDDAIYTEGESVLYEKNGALLQYKAISSCGGEIKSNEVAITVNDVATIADITAPAAICAGSSLALPTPVITTNGSTVTDGKWYLDGAVYTEGESVLYEKNGALLQYKAMSSCGGEIKSNEVAITVNDVATIADITAPEAICAGSSLALPTPVITTNGSTVTDGKWYLDGAVYTEGESVLYEKNGALLQYKAMSSCGGEIKSNEVAITVNDVATIADITAPEAICAGSSLALPTPVITTNGSTVTDGKWYLDGAVYTEGESVLYEKNGALLQYKAMSSCGGEIESNKVAIIVKNNATISDITAPAAICAGTPLTLITPVITENGSTVTNANWYLDGEVYTEGESVLYEKNGKTLQYKATSSCGGEIKSNEVTIVVDALPVVTLTATDVTLNCRNTSATITASGANRYEWSYTDLSGASQTKTGATLDVQLSEVEQLTSTTTYAVYGYSENANCKSANPVTVNVTENKRTPVVETLISATSLEETVEGYKETQIINCKDTELFIKATIVDNVQAGYSPEELTYDWTYSEDGDMYEAYGTGETTSTTTEGFFRLVVTDKETGCTSAATTIEIKEVKTTPVITMIESVSTIDPAAEEVVKTNELTCDYPVLYLKPTIQSENEVSYKWNDESTNNYLEVNEKGTYSLVVTDNTTFCSTEKYTYNVTENKQAPTFTVDATYYLCPSDTLTKTTLSSLLPKTSGVTYKFYDESGDEIEDLYDASSAITEYYVTGVSENGCESEKVSFAVDLAKNVDFTLTASQTSMLVGGNETVITIIPNAESEEADTYTWQANGNEIAVDGLEYSTNLYLDTKFEVTATNRCDSKSQEVSIEVLWPTAFTPHNDNGKNDDFAKGMPIIVFNRFYTKIFEGPDGWDGTINGTMNDSKNIAVPGVYYYKVDLPNGEVKKGTIEIVR